jgi:sortase A
MGVSDQEQGHTHSLPNAAACRRSAAGSGPSAVESRPSASTLCNVEPSAAVPVPEAATARPGFEIARRVLRETGIGLITLGLVVLAFVAYQLWGTGLTESHDQSVLQRQFAALHSQATASAGTGSAGATSSGHTGTGHTGSGAGAGGSNAGAHDPVVGTSSSEPASSHRGAAGRAANHALTPSPPVGQAVDHIVIPSVGVNKYVVQGVAENDLMEGPGHYPGTPLPGQAGNVGIAGHRTTYGAPFFELGRLRRGAWIYITDTEGRTFDYRVLHHLVVNPDDVGVLAPSHRAILTLTTCNPPYSATTRLVVVAALVGRPATTITHRRPSAATTAGDRSGGATSSSSTGSSSSSSSETVTPAAPTVASLTAGNANARGPAIAFGALVVALWVATRILASRRRGWRKTATLAVGVVVAAVPLWLCFQQVVRLLPPTV